VSQKHLVQANSYKFTYVCSSSVLTDFQNTSHSNIYDFFAVRLIFTFLEIIIISLCSEMRVMFRTTISTVTIFLLFL